MSREQILESAIRDIRNRVHAHNRGGELRKGLRETIRDICDEALREIDGTSDIV